MDSSEVASFYGRGNLGDTLFGALGAAGFDPANLGPEDLSPVDEFHIRGAEATGELMELAGFGPEDRVLDVGCGIGGPARRLARERGCLVTGLELTEEYCRLAADLTARVGLAGQVAFQQGDAQAMPFGDASFDGVWTLHMSMNVPDKARLLGEIRRVLRPGGRLAMYEIVAGSGEAVHYPVPWASDPALSHLTTAEGLRSGLEGQGFRVVHSEDTSDRATEFFASLLERSRKEGPPALGLHLLLGPDMPKMATNMLHNLEEGRIRVLRLVMDG